MGIGELKWAIHIGPGAISALKLKRVNESSGSLPGSVYEKTLNSSPKKL